MRFVCLVHIDKQLIGAASPAELEQFDRDCRDSDAALIASGNYVTALALAEPDQATLIRRRDGVRTVTDGPYAEAREHIGGFFVIEAPDYATALALVQDDPTCRYGTLEIRPELGRDWQKQQQNR